jgi:hypothetical protein
MGIFQRVLRLIGRKGSTSGRRPADHWEGAFRLQIADLRLRIEGPERRDLGLHWLVFGKYV